MQMLLDIKQVEKKKKEKKKKQTNCSPSMQWFMVSIWPLSLFELWWLWTMKLIKPRGFKILSPLSFFLPYCICLTLSLALSWYHSLPPTSFCFMHDIPASNKLIWAPLFPLLACNSVHERECGEWAIKAWCITIRIECEYKALWLGLRLWCSGYKGTQECDYEGRNALVKTAIFFWSRLFLCKCITRKYGLSCMRSFVIRLCHT